MNTANLKAYAPKARRDFIAAVSKQALKYGVTKTNIHSVQVKGDVCVVDGKPFPASFAPRIRRFSELVGRLGFDQTMEQVAYSWFNRIIAIRYMELHDYLDHGRRVLSHPEHPTGYQILDECTDITYGTGGQLPHLKHAKVLELKLDGTKDEELYRELLLAQCHALHKAMPFLFENVDDETELLLPENLTNTDSLIGDLTTDIPEEDWQNIEVIGWLYQFYISDKKDDVIGKVVKSEDIPAATQLFTPNWIVKYMVQNSLGAQWLATYPDSPLKAQMEYYIEPAEQTDEVNAQLRAITPEELNPEELTLIDPASGSGHILVEAYDLFKAIYLERGYRQRDIAQLILEKNLFGLDIDQRAAQLTGFALMMKGREGDRRLFDRGIRLNVMALKNSIELDVQSLNMVFPLSNFGLLTSDLVEFNNLFEHATTFGSLIQVPKAFSEKLPAIKKLASSEHDDWLVKDALQSLAVMVKQAEILVGQYNSVVANPPYMGAKAFNSKLKNWMKLVYKGNDKDLFSAFIARMLTLTNDTGYSAVMTSFVWMFIASFEQLRKQIVENHTINSLVQLHYDAFAEAKAHICTFVIQKSKIKSQKSSFVRLSDFAGVDNQGPKTLEAIHNRTCGWLFETLQDEFVRIPGSPIAYWISNSKPFDGPRIGSGFESGGRTKTHDNETYLRFSWEVNNDSDIWERYANGGDFRKYAGNDLHVINWSDSAREYYDSHGGLYAKKFWGKAGVSWGLITSARVSFRVKEGTSHYSSGSPTIFAESNVDEKIILAFLNSPIAYEYLKAMNPTVNTTVNDVLGLPLPSSGSASTVKSNVNCLIDISQTDWDGYERSMSFKSFPLLHEDVVAESIESSYLNWIKNNEKTILKVKELEEANNREFISLYELQKVFVSDVPLKQVSLTINPSYRYGGELTDSKRGSRFREDTIQELISYIIGCIMGRYSLDELGLIYANSGNINFDASRYAKFPADDDAIVPLTDREWFSDDAANRIIEFISVAWPAEHLKENLAFLATNLSPKNNEDSRATIRRYLCDKFYKGHMQTYKKRPIYWLFSSGKQKSFQCLVYLHRYNEGTLSRMRTEYVIPLTAMLSSHIDKLDTDKLASSSTAEVKKLEKEIKNLQKQQTELTEFDEKLKHFADQRIKLDLDDGVKVNYGKFGDLLAEVKAIHGKVV